MGDAFYRWDGFRYYASFSEFLPSIALALILWSIVAVTVSIAIWITLWTCEWGFQRIGLRANAYHLLIFIGSFIFLGILVWISKQFLVSSDHSVTMRTKLALSACILLVSTFITWISRNKAIRWMETVQERITPLVWIFGICVTLAIPLVTYHTWLKPSDDERLQKNTESSVTDRKRPNIIVVIFDALAAQDMSLYGYGRPTTPFIDEWSKSASLFTRAKANSNWTTPSMVSLITGKRVWTHQVYNIDGQVSDKSSENIASVLKNNGYYNIAFITNDYASAKRLGINNDLDIAPAWRMPNSSLLEILNTSLYRMFADKIRLYNWILKEDFVLYKLLFVISPRLTKTILQLDIVFEHFIKSLDNAPAKPYFAWIHLYPPHNPYVAPAPYMGMFDSSSEFRDIESQAKIHKQFMREGYLGEKKHFPEDIQGKVDILRSRYDEFIRYCDSEFKNFIEKLQKSGKLDNTIIILTSDHGDSFEHGFFTHGGPYLHETMTHIPLIIKEPGQSEGKVIEDLVEQVDISATILDLANIPSPPWVEGRSLVPFLRGESLPKKPVFSMNAKTNMGRGHEISSGCLSVWQDDYKLMYRLETDEIMLFNLARDPHELNNLFDKEPEIGQSLLSILNENLKIANEKIRKESGTLDTKHVVDGHPDQATVSGKGKD
jgi:arylsulfatase A-like enzyme